MYEEDDDDDFDERGVLKDGHRFHVPLRMLDGLQRNIARHFARVHDGGGGLVGHKPGFVVGNDALSADQHQRAYDAYDAELATSWKNNSPTGAGSGELVGQRTGDLCTIDGEAGHLRKINGELRCVPDREPNAAPTMDKIYITYDSELAEAWRNAR